jgi:hypothetical protein
VESSGSSLRVEPLRAAHLHALKVSDRTEQRSHLQQLLFRSLIARLNHLWPGDPITRQPCVLVALEQGLPRSLVQIRPFNRLGSCWQLSLEELSPSKALGQRELLKQLLQEALIGANVRSRSWVIRCDSSHSDQLHVLRELGFQPLRSLRIWEGPDRDASEPCQPLPEFCQWAPLNRRTAPFLWPLEQSSGSSHLRQITGRRCVDLLDHAGHHSGVLLARTSDHPVALAGLIHQELADGTVGLELLSGVAWDERLSRALPSLLHQLQIDGASCHLAVGNEQTDTTVNQLLASEGWKPIREELLLGRSLWRHHGRSRAVPFSHPLETMLGRLQPQHPPLPTPSLGRR